MRILFLESNPKWIDGLPNGFSDLGHEIMISGPLTNDNLPCMLTKFKPHIIFLTGWTSENQYRIKQYIKPSGIPLIYWATEDPGYTKTFTLPLIRRLSPDFIFTICNEMVNDYTALGFKAAHMDFGYHESVHHPTESDHSYKCKVAVVANGYVRFLKRNSHSFRLKSIQTLITPVLKTEIPVHFWGFEWQQMNPFVGCDIPSNWIHGHLYYPDAYKVYNSADIVIGIQNCTYQVTQRTYEVLGSKGLLLTSDTPAIRNLFTPGQDLIVSATPEETLKLVRYYLNNPTERERIRAQGHQTVTIHNYRQRADYIIRVLKEHNILASSTR